MSSKPKRRDPTPAERAATRQQQDRADRARRSYQKLDARGVYRDRCRELAESVGADVEAIYEEFGERAGTREYLGVTTIEDAEEQAWIDVRDRIRAAS